MVVASSLGCPGETWGSGAHPCLLAGLSISCRVVAAALRHVHAHPLCPPCCPPTYLPFPSTGSSWVAASSLAFHGVGDTTPQILLSPAWTRAAPATSSWDVEDVPWDGTLGTDWAPVPPPISPSLHVASGMLPRLGAPLPSPSCQAKDQRSALAILSLLAP